jgi:phosphoglycerate dehydrogenase-like enzyme
MALKSVLVLGMGKVGTLVGVLLNKTGFRVVGIARSEKTDHPFETKKIVTI